MLRRRLEQSIIISAQEGPNEEPITLLGHELGEESLAFRCFAPLDTAAMWSLQLARLAVRSQDHWFSTGHGG